MKSGKLNLFRAIHKITVGVAFSLAGWTALAIVLNVTPTSAFAATAASSEVAARNKAQAKPTLASRKPARKLKQRRVKAQKAVANTSVRKVAVRRRLVYRRSAYAHRSGIRKVMFAPAPLSFGRASGLHKAPDSLALRSSVAYVIDQNTNELLYEKNSNAVLPIASISKLMTAMVVLDANLPLNEMLQVTNEDRDLEKGTHSRLSVGSRLTRDDMLHIALMASENRAAAALSRYYPGGRAAFIAAMNQKALLLGMTQTHFANSTGLSSLNVSTARDLAKMVNAAYQYPLIRQFSTDVTHSVYTGRQTLRYNTSNALVRNLVWEIGVQKTGFINEAGECLVMQATLLNRPVIMVLLDSTGKYSRFGDAQRIRTWLSKSNMQHMTSTDVRPEDL